MGRLVRCALQSLLKLMNSVIGLVGMGMILYALWMMRAWYRQIHASDASPSWVIYTFFGLGVTFCLISCSGYIAAETANGHCLSYYMVFVFVLLVLEAAITADIFLNRNWEEDFPEDPTGKFDELNDFVKANVEMCKWVGLSFAAAQAMSIFLAMVLRALGPDHGSYYDSDDDTVPTRLPLLRNQVQHTGTADTNVALKKDSWHIKIHDKVNR